MPIITGRSPTGDVRDIAIDEDGKLLLSGTIPVSGTITATTTSQAAISISGVSVTVPVSGFPTSTGISSCTVTLPVSGTVTTTVPLAVSITGSTVTLPVSGFPTSIEISGISIATSGASSSLLVTEAPYWDYQALAYSGTDTVAVTSITYKTGGSGGTTVLIMTYGYDAAGNVTSITKT